MASRKRAAEDDARNSRNLDSAARLVREVAEESANRAMAHTFDKTLEANTFKFFELVKKQPFRSSAVILNAEYDYVYTSEFYYKDDVYAKIRSTLTQFVKEHPVELCKIIFAEWNPPGSIWKLYRLHGAVHVEKKKISQRPLKHFAQISGIGIVGMATNTLCCDYNEKLGQFTALEEIEFKVSPLDTEAMKHGGGDRKVPWAPAFLAGDWRCVQNKFHIQITGPPNTRDGSRPEYFREFNEMQQSYNSEKVVGFHVWDDHIIILLTRTLQTMVIHKFEVRTGERLTQEDDFKGIQSRVARVDGTDEQSLFVLAVDQVREFRYNYAHGGFYQVRQFIYLVPKRFTANMVCFQVGPQYMCVGTKTRVIFHDIAQKIADMEARKQFSAEMTADFNVRCRKPVDMIFANPGEKNDLLVSSADGVQLWALDSLREKLLELEFAP